MPLIRSANSVRVSGGILYFLHKTIHNSSAVKELEHEIMLGVASITTDTLTVSAAIVYFVNPIAKNKSTPTSTTITHKTTSNVSN